MIDGWDAAAELWAAVIDRAAAGGQLAEIAITLRTASATAARLHRPDEAAALAAAIPAVREPTILPPILPEPDHVPTPPGRLANALQDALAACVPTQPALTIDPPSAAPTVNTIARDGDTWLLSYQGQLLRIHDLKGVANLAALLIRPQTEMHCLELMNASVFDDDTGPLVDETAKARYRQRIVDLQADIDEAQDNNDVGRAEQARIELDALVDQLTSAFGLSGRSRVAGSSTERARSAITYRLRAAIKSISSIHPTLGRHLSNSIRTGTWCSYRPETETTWNERLVPS